MATFKIFIREDLCSWVVKIYDLETENVLYCKVIEMPNGDLNWFFDSLQFNGKIEPFKKLLQFGSDPSFQARIVTLIRLMKENEIEKITLQHVQF